MVKLDLLKVETTSEPASYRCETYRPRCGRRFLWPWLSPICVSDFIKSGMASSFVEYSSAWTSPPNPVVLFGTPMIYMSTWIPGTFSSSIGVGSGSPTTGISYGSWISSWLDWRSFLLLWQEHCMQCHFHLQKLCYPHSQRHWGIMSCHLHCHVHVPRLGWLGGSYL